MCLRGAPAPSLRLPHKMVAACAPLLATCSSIGSSDGVDGDLKGACRRRIPLPWSDVCQSDMGTTRLLNHTVPAVLPLLSRRRHRAWCARTCAAIGIIDHRAGGLTICFNHPPIPGRACMLRQADGEALADLKANSGSTCILAEPQHLHAPLRRSRLLQTCSASHGSARMRQTMAGQ